MEHLVFKSRIFSVCLVLVLVCSFWGCSKENSKVETDKSFEIVEETFNLSECDYSLISENDEHYIYLVNASQYAEENSSIRLSVGRIA